MNTNNLIDKNDEKVKQRLISEKDTFIEFSKYAMAQIVLVAKNK
jgi:hypothetical protein